MIRFIGSVDTCLSSIFRRIIASTDVDTAYLACYRIFFGALLLLYFLPTWAWLKDIPPAFFDPFVFSIANFTNDHLPGFLYQSADILAILFSLLIITGVYTRFAFFGMFVLSTIFYSYYYSFGKIDHHTTILIFAFLVLSFTNSGTRFALRKDKKVALSTQQKALAILGIIICFGFFSAGLPKLMKWVDFDLNTSGFLFWFYPAYFLSHKQMFMTQFAFQIPVFLLECMDYFASVFEVMGFFFLLKGKKFWLGYLLMASFFHLANLLLMNIDFSLNMLSYGIFLIAPVVYFIFKRYGPILVLYKRLIFFIFILLGMLKIILLLFDKSFLFSNYDSIDFALKNWINLFLWMITIFCGILVLIKFTKFCCNPTNDGVPI